MTSHRPRFSDGGRPVITPTYNGIATCCAVTDSFDDGGSDFAISLEAATIEVGSGCTQYEISLDHADLELGMLLVLFRRRAR
ncbi:MAG: hypothetical protein WBN09_08705 [Woeseiaceae bacterium]